jgi:DHA2 family multidrug resistance protein-like MFS transporter
VAGRLPEPLAASLLDTAREAFIAGLHVTAVTGALVLAGLAVMTAVLLRRVASAESAPELLPDQAAAA